MISLCLIIVAVYLHHVAETLKRILQIHPEVIIQLLLFSDSDSITSSGRLLHILTMQKPEKFSGSFYCSVFLNL